MLFSSMSTCQSGSLCNHRQNKVTPYLLAIHAVTHLLKGLVALCSVATEQLLVLSELESYRFGHPTLLGPISSWETNYSLPSASSQASPYNGCVCGIVRLWASGQALVFPVPANEPNKISFVLCSVPSAQRMASCVANHSLYLPTAAAQLCPETREPQSQFWSRSRCDLLLPSPAAGYSQGAVSYAARHLWWAKSALVTCCQCQWSPFMEVVPSSPWDTFFLLPYFFF